MTHETDAYDDSALTTMEHKLRESLARAQASAQGRLKGLSTRLLKHPLASLVVAFLAGLGVARLLQKLE